MIAYAQPIRPQSDRLLAHNEGHQAADMFLSLRCAQLMSPRPAS